MAIPILMFGLALSVIIGTVACWKVRAQIVARDAIFSRRWQRDGAPDPQPPEWRVANATRGDRAGAQLTELDHPVFQNPLIRGPLPGISVDNEMFDPKNYARIGTARLTRSPPALAKLGPFSLNVQEPLLDGKWQYLQLGYPSNGSRRIRLLYDLLNIAAALDEKAQYDQARQQTIAVYQRPEMAVLDRDDELLAWYGRLFDFHPRLPLFCSLDTNIVRERYVEPHLSRVALVPRTMTDRFLALYRSQLNSLPQPPQPLSPAQQAQKAELERKIRILEAFLDTLN
jgi:hypothetical protein